MCNTLGGRVCSTRERRGDANLPSDRALDRHMMACSLQIGQLSKSIATCSGFCALHGGKKKRMEDVRGNILFPTDGKTTSLHKSPLSTVINAEIGSCLATARCTTSISWVLSHQMDAVFPLFPSLHRCIGCCVQRLPSPEKRTNIHDLEDHTAGLFLSPALVEGWCRWSLPLAFLCFQHLTLPLFSQIPRKRHSFPPGAVMVEASPAHNRHNHRGWLIFEAVHLRGNSSLHEKRSCAGIKRTCIHRDCSMDTRQPTRWLATWAWMVLFASLLTQRNAAHNASAWAMVRPERKLHENTTYDVSLDGSAFLSSYYFGVMASLEEMGVIEPGQSVVSGISAGAIVALTSCLQFPFEEANQILKELSRKCEDSWDRKRELLPCQGTLYRELRIVLHRIIESKPLAYQKCSGKLRTFVLALNPKTRGQRRSTHIEISQYTSNEDLKDAIGAATFVPCWSACQPYVLFRGMPVVDGTFQMPQEKFCPVSTRNCIRVRVNQPGQYTLNPTRPCNFLLSQAGAFLENRVRNIGCVRSSREAPFEKQGILPQSCPFFPLQVPTIMRNADIYPGKFPENPLATTCYQHQRGLFFPDLENIDALFQQGKLDGRIWATQKND